MADIVLPTPTLVPDQVTWPVDAGSEAVCTFTLWADADKTVPVDLTGFTGRGEARTRLGGTLLASIQVTVAGNVVTLTIPATASEGWGPRQTAGVFDAELVPADPDATVRLCSGVLAISPNVTTGAI